MPRQPTTVRPVVYAILFSLSQSEIEFVTSHTMVVRVYKTWSSTRFPSLNLCIRDLGAHHVESRIQAAGSSSDFLVLYQQIQTRVKSPASINIQSWTCTRQITGFLHAVPIIVRDAVIFCTTWQKNDAESEPPLRSLHQLKIIIG